MTAVTLLLVEDDPSLQEGVRDLLEIADFDYSVTVVTASDGLEALDRLKETAVDLIISDIMMPNMSGYELLGHVRENPDWVHVPFIFVSAKGRKQDMIEGRLSGAEMYITKPFDSLELIDMIKIQLNRSLNTRAHQKREMSSLKREVLQVLNHEFRTPLTYVTAYYEMLASSISVYKDTENVGDFLRGIRTGCERMSNLVEDMIHVMDARSGELFHRYREEGAFCQNGVQRFLQLKEKFLLLAEKEKVDFQFEIPQELPHFFCLESEYFIAIGHLVENGIKFSSARINRDRTGEVRVSLLAEDGCLKVNVHDNGIGIPSSVQSQIFDMFFQYKRDKYEQQGSGMGLTIAKGIIDAHHGTLTVASKEGEGTAVEAEIPIMPAWPSDAAPQDDAVNLSADLSSQRLAHLLIVEDEDSVRDGLVDLLRIADTAYKFTFDTACDGVEGLEKAAQRKPDLIISDVMMPKMNGYDFVSKLRQSPDFVQVPVIFLSARTDKKEILHGRRIGAEDYLTKPYDSNELLSLTTAVLNRYFQLKKSADSDFEQLKINILSMLRPDFLGSLADVDNYSVLISNSSSDLNTSSDLRDALLGIQAGSQRVSELVEDFISLAEIQTGEAKTSFENQGQSTIEVAKLFEPYVENSPGRDAAGVKFNFMVDEQTRPVVIDKAGIERAIKRLISISEINCLKGNGQTVYIELEEREPHLQIEIWHDGKNLDQHTSGLIQATLTDPTNNWGDHDAKELVYGPRLIIARHFIEASGGKLVFISGHKDDGSLTSDAFSILLPFAEKDSGKGDAVDSAAFHLNSF